MNKYRGWRLEVGPMAVKWKDKRVWLGHQKHLLGLSYLKLNINQGVIGLRLQVSLIPSGSTTPSNTPHSSHVR